MPLHATILDCTREVRDIAKIKANKVRCRLVRTQAFARSEEQGTAVNGNTGRPRLIISIDFPRVIVFHVNGDNKTMSMCISAKGHDRILLLQDGSTARHEMTRF